MEVWNKRNRYQWKRQKKWQYGHFDKTGIEGNESGGGKFVPNGL